MTEIPAFERAYDIEGLKEKILVQIYGPKSMNGDWVYERALTGPGVNFRERAHTGGVDKLQALVLTLKRITVELEHLSEKLGRRITWLGEPGLDLD